MAHHRLPMKRFAELYTRLDSSTATIDKVAALKEYFAAAPAADAAWAVYFLAGGKPRQVVPTSQLRRIACEVARIDEWLFEECYQAVGDLAETIAHVLPPPTRSSEAGLAHWVEERLLRLRGAPPEEQARALRDAWDELDTAGRFLLTKLIGGAFRVGVSKLLVQRALAELSGVDAKRVAQRMMGYTDGKTLPDAASYQRLVSHGLESDADEGQPYPFFLAHPLDVPLAQFDARLGPPEDWFAEWKYDGIRAQIVRRGDGVWIWSRGEELMTDRFPELVERATQLAPGTVLDGEVLVCKDERPAPFALLQQRIGRKTLTKKVLSDAPVSFIAYDLLEWQGEDLRGRPQRERRDLLERSGVDRHFSLSPRVYAANWSELAALREESRRRGVEGLMLKHAQSAYGAGRTKSEGTWWKWKIDPLTIDAVLIYAQAGHGRRASVYTDYTFAVWNRPPISLQEAQSVVQTIADRRPVRPPSAEQPDPLQLVPFAKAYSGLTDEEFRRIDTLIRKTTVEKFGPVRSLVPSLVFELGFEGINRSMRHKSGIAVRFPRMLRIRDDKPLHEADSLETLSALLAIAGAPQGT
jgi:DNA ligase-1